MSFSFASPWLLWGAGLITVPILIHLINRRRFVIQPFAALRFLKQAYEERRKRLRMESLLLLLLRCLVVLLAALAMALPFVPSDSPLAIMSGARTELVMLVDRSGSMARRVSAGVTLDDRVLETVRARLRTLSDDRGDAVTIVFMGRGTSLAVPIGATPSVAIEALEGALSPPGGVADVVAAARMVKERVQPLRPGRLDIELYSDLQELSWGGLGASLGAIFGEVLEVGGGRLRVSPVGADLDATRNLGVEALAAGDPLLLPGEASTFTAVVRNHGETAINAVEGSFFVDGELRNRVRVDVPPRNTGTVTLRTRLDTPGAHHVAFALERDELVFDDARTLAIDVRPGVEVLIVDGAPGGADPLSGASGYLELVLNPDELGRTPRFRPSVYDVAAFEQVASDLSRFDVIVLANVGGLTEAAADALADAVRSGTPLLVFLGDKVDAALYNERLVERGLMPARIGVVMGDPGGSGGEDYVTLVLPEPVPEALALFADPRLSVLLKVPVLAWRELEPLDDTRVLASFADALGTTRPAIVEGQLGRGRVLLVGTSADDTWSLLPRFPATWVPFVYEIMSDLAAPDAAQSNVPVGEGPQVSVRGVPVTAQLTQPSGTVVAMERPDYERFGNRSILSLDAAPLAEPGAYTLSVRTAESDQSFALAALPDAREGDLARIDLSRLDDVFDGVPYVLGDADADPEDADLDGGDGSLAMALLWVLLIAALGESLLARWMGMSR